MLAVWTYGLLDVSPEVNEIINHLYYSLLNLYWPPERNIIESEYRDIILPFHKMSTPRFQMRTNWSVEQLIGYLCTWSAVKKFESDRGFNPVLSLHSKLIESWGDVAQKHIVKWPLIVKAWNKTGSS